MKLLTTVAVLVSMVHAVCCCLEDVIREEEQATRDVLNALLDAVETTNCILGDIRDALNCDDPDDGDESVCGSDGWTKIAELDMSDPSQQCPAELRAYDEGGVRACGRQESSSGSCTSITFSTGGISYSQVCGRVVGYQYGSPDAIHGQYDVPIDDPYVDGVSITRGSPREHIWTLAAGYREMGNHVLWQCHCNTGSTETIQAFIGDDYYCESGNSASGWDYRLYTEDQLWDNQDCGGDEGPCCNVRDIPWFNKVLDTATTEDIEMRVCANERTGDEDTPVSLYEIYVK